MTMRLLPLALLLVAGMSACKGGGEATPPPTGLDEYQSEAPAPAAERDSTVGDSIGQLPPLTSQGFGPVRLGMHIDRLPGKLPGVYDSIAVSRDQDEGMEFVSLRFFNRGHQVMEGMCIENATHLDALIINTPGLPLRAGMVNVEVGSRLSTLKGIPGMRHLPEDELDGERMEWRGVTLYLNADTVSFISIGNLL